MVVFEEVVVAEASLPRLRVQGLVEPLLDRSWVVLPGRPLVFGRGVAADPEPGVLAVSVPDLRLSARHCRIEHQASGFRVVDLGSKNGVSVNGDRLARGASRALASGDHVTLGGITLRVEELPAPGEERPATAATRSRTRTGGAGPPATWEELAPYPLAAGYRETRETIGEVAAALEVVRSFEALVQLHTLVALSEYAAQSTRHDAVTALLADLGRKAFSVGRWLELHRTLLRSLDEKPVVQELGTWFEGSGAREPAFSRAASRLVEIRNGLLHGERLTEASAGAVSRELRAAASDIHATLAFWLGYRVIAVDPGDWEEGETLFRYTGKLLRGCTLPFRSVVVESRGPLPSRVPVVVNREGTRRLSLAPFQALLPAEDGQPHWFWMADARRGRLTMATYPAPFSTSAPPALTDAALAILAGNACPSPARAPFSGRILERLA